MSKRKRRERRSGNRGTATSVIPPQTTRIVSSTTGSPGSASQRAAPSGRHRAGSFGGLGDRLRRLGRTELFIAAVVVLAIAVALYLLLNQSPPRAVGRQVPLEPVTHHQPGTPLTFQNYPPSSGPHYTATQPWGVYQQEVPEGFWVHNLEHGGIIFLYNCPAGCPDLQKQLEDTFKTFPPGKYGQVKLIVAPYSKMQSKVAAVAWGWILELDQFDREKLLEFYKAHVDRGPEDVP